MFHPPTSRTLDEISGALHRAYEDRAERTLRPSDLLRLAAVVCIGVGLVLDGMVVLATLAVIGPAALWLSFRRDDRAVERAVAAGFDRTTGLPSAAVLDTVMADDLVTRTLNGRLAVVAIDVPELAARRAAGDQGAADALLAATVHRLRSHGWVGAQDGPFAPLVFLRRPGVFFVVLRDVLDDRTTRWLAERMHGVLDAAVPWNGGSLEPGVALGLAIGSTAERGELAWQANDARCRARRPGAGRVVVADDPARRRTAAPVEESLVAVADDTRLGRVFRPETAGGEMFTELASFLRALDRAVDRISSTGESAAVVVPPTTLLHWDAPGHITARVDAAGLHGRLTLIAPPTLADRETPAVRDTLETLRCGGIRVLADRRTDARPAAPGPGFDGVVVGQGADVSQLGPGITIASIAGPTSVAAPSPTPAPSGLGSGPSHPPGGTDRPLWGGQSAHLPQGPVVAAR